MCYGRAGLIPTFGRQRHLTALLWWLFALRQSANFYSKGLEGTSLGHPEVSGGHGLLQLTKLQT